MPRIECRRRVAATPRPGPNSRKLGSPRFALTLSTNCRHQARDAKPRYGTASRPVRFAAEPLPRRLTSLQVRRGRGTRRRLD